MKRISILVIALTALTSCSNDDAPKSCNCEITTASYNEVMQAYEPISTEFYSSDCNDYSPYFNPDGKGTYYSIQCTSN